MQRPYIASFWRNRALRSVVGLIALALGGGTLTASCGGDDEAKTSPAGSTGTPAGGTGGAGTTGATTGGGGAPGPAYSCTTTMIGATRGSAIASTPDDKLLVAVNRDVGSVTIASVDYSGTDPALTKVAELDLGAGSEPWQVAIDGCGTRAYVVLRKEQKLVVIDDLTGTPAVGRNVNVGSEPTSVAITPNNTAIYVANWVDGTVTVVDPTQLTVTGTVDLNTTLAATGLLGTVAPRAALAHPRAIAITNNGDAEDGDESVLVTEWSAQRTEAEKGDNADTNWKGLLYKFDVGKTEASTIDLPPVTDTGFTDQNGAVTGCFPNQVGTVTTQDGFAYVTSVCASPKGPIGVATNAGACPDDAACGIGGVCNTTTRVCSTNNLSVTTTTHTGLTIVNLADGSAQSEALDRRFFDKNSDRMPHLPSDLGFFKNFAYITGLGADAVFRLVTGNGAISAVGSDTNNFINLRLSAADKLIRSPIGIATSHDPSKTFAFVANDGSRDITALAFSRQAVAGDASNGAVLQASALPAAGTPEAQRLNGKRFFSTGLGRWSLKGQAWGSCAACHLDGLTDNVTWYFARGPRQTTSLDGSFASNDPTDQRLFNWTAIFDEVADFENNTRGISGGVGAIVSTTSNPPNVTDRINIAGENPPQQGLQGSTADIADRNGTSEHPHGTLDDWKDIEAWIKSIRSPRRPTNLVKADVDAGRALFAPSGAGNCVGCHSGAKWTISKRFYTPNDVANPAFSFPDNRSASLSSIPWDATAGDFPKVLFPVLEANLPTEARMRFGAPPGAEQIQCILRPVGTFGVSPPFVDETSGTVNNGLVKEVRQDMTTPAQGNAANGRGYNPPALLGMQVGAPYFHAGNARTIEELFDDSAFSGHHRSAIAQVFTPDATSVRQLVAFVLSIDEDEPAFNIPTKGATGGDLCFYLQ